MAFLARHKRWIGLGAALGVLLVVYLATLQTLPNGADHYFTADVGETQIVLNTWGTLHMTGYPVYVPVGNVLTSVLRALGVSAVTAPALVSLGFGLLALALTYALAHALTGSVLASMTLVLLLGLTRTVWIHHVIAEVYTFGLALQMGLLLVALAPTPGPSPTRREENITPSESLLPPPKGGGGPGRGGGRIYWLALLGGIAVGHHRALIMLAPGLLVAAWPVFRAARPRSLPRLVGLSLLLGLLGLFVPYVYLPLRDLAAAGWVYGQPGTWTGFWEQFWGVEAGHFVGLPESLAALRANVELVTNVLLHDLTPPGLLFGVFGLIWALVAPHDQHDRRLRRAAVTLGLTALIAYTFHALLYQDALSALILLITVPVAFGWLFALCRAARWLDRQGWRVLAPPHIHLPARPATRYFLAGILLLPLGAALLLGNWPFIRGITQDDSALRTIAIASGAPEGSTLFVAWGLHHFAVGIAQDVEPALAPASLQRVTLVDHDAPFYNLLQAGEMLVTPAFTFYNQPLAWWEARLVGGPVYLQAAGPELVQIMLEPARPADPPHEFGPLAEAITCTDDAVILDVTWFTPDAPGEDLRVFVHAWDVDGVLAGQGDQAAPVYGWRPLTTWTAGETVRDVYPVYEVDPGLVDVIRYGLYRVTGDGGFENVYEYEVPVGCE